MDSASEPGYESTADMPEEMEIPLVYGPGDPATHRMHKKNHTVDGVCSDEYIAMAVAEADSPYKLCWMPVNVEQENKGIGENVTIHGKRYVVMSAPTQVITVCKNNGYLVVMPVHSYQKKRPPKDPSKKKGGKGKGRKGGDNSGNGLTTTDNTEAELQHSIKSLLARLK